VDSREGGAWLLLASPLDGAGIVKIHQDAHVLLARLSASQRLSHRLKPGRHAWLHAVRGSLTLNDVRLEEGDGAGTADEAILEIAATASAEALLFDVS
jgi:redox-sensitive bicupin YhaK (pirin superfamily)